MTLFFSSCGSFFLLAHASTRPSLCQPDLMFSAECGTLARKALAVNCLKLTCHMPHVRLCASSWVQRCDMFQAAFIKHVICHAAGCVPSVCVPAGFICQRIICIGHADVTLRSVKGTISQLPMVTPMDGTCPSAHHAVGLLLVLADHENKHAYRRADSGRICIMWYICISDVL